MPQVKFNLSDHTHDIRKIADANNCSPEEGLRLFIANLAVMREHYKGASNLNYHALGQLWNGLSGSERNTQRAEAKARLVKRYNAGGQN